ncbi:hypothetical protein D3C72_2037220 [compost metagenome]
MGLNGVLAGTVLRASRLNCASMLAVGLGGIMPPCTWIGPGVPPLMPPLALAP